MIGAYPGAISDNPLCFPETGKIAHGSNFFGQPVAFEDGRPAEGRGGARERSALKDVSRGEVRSLSLVPDGEPAEAKQPGDRPWAGAWGRSYEAVLHRFDDAGLIDVSRVVLDSAHVGAGNGGELKVRDPLFFVSMWLPRSPSGTSRSRLPRSAGQAGSDADRRTPGVDAPLDPPPARHA